MTHFIDFRTSSISFFYFEKGLHLFKKILIILQCIVKVHVEIVEVFKLVCLIVSRLLKVI